MLKKEIYKTRFISRSCIRKNQTYNRIFDIWLQRISYASQTGLFILTAVTLYFTVLPLYQKALLDEAIAKKEIELKLANEEIDKAYFQLSKYILNSFVLEMHQCSGAMLIVKLIDTESSLIEIDAAEAELFDFDVKNCFQNKIQKSKNLELLKDSDKEYIIKNTLAIGDKINNARLLSKNEYVTVLDRATNDPESLSSELGYFHQRFRDIAPHLSISPQEIATRTLESKIIAEKSKIVSNYLNNNSKEINSLRELKF